MKTKRWKHIRNYSIIIYDENAMEIGNKDTQYNVSKKNHTTITQRYKCLLHAKFGNQPYPDYINVSYMLSLVINHTQMIYIDYYMAFFISYPLSARELIGSRDDIWTRVGKGYDMKNDMLWYVYHTLMFIIYFNRGNNWFVPKCLVILAKIK
jgi:hypothetical protein